MRPLAVFWGGVELGAGVDDELGAGVDDELGGGVEELVAAEGAKGSRRRRKGVDKDVFDA